MTVNNKMFKRAVSMILCMAMLITVLPAAAFAAPANGGEWITTVADPATLTRPEVIYGDNTLNAGKITVGKSVSDSNITVNGQTVTIDGDNNFLVTISQSAQVMGPVPAKRAAAMKRKAKVRKKVRKKRTLILTRLLPVMVPVPAVTAA